MKLLNKTSIYYLLFALPVFAICSGLLYFFVSSQIIDSLDESLIKEKTTIEANLKRGETTQDLDDEVILKPIGTKTISSKNSFSDTLIYDSTEAELIPYRLLVSTVGDGHKNYFISIRTSHIESDDLITSILYPVLILFIVLLAGFFLINWFISKKLWDPFYKTLEQLNNYRIDERAVKFDGTSIREFSELNRVLNAMTEKMHTDFINQKQFIENASHEIQTPLAVIKTKIELLIQSNTISESDMLLIQSVYNASNKLSSLNKALLLLSKIENNQFKDVEEIQFKTLIEKTVEHFEDLISLKQIQIKKDYQSTPAHKMNPILADILITNLLQNAIRHNIKDGSIVITLTDNSISISNTSNTSTGNTNELFQRFKKNEASAESIGLGLAIVKEICDNYGIHIRYTCVKSVHTFQLNF
jgi:signal transduction histidine kinase